MISRNKGILSLEFLVPNVGLLVAILGVNMFYHYVVTPRSKELMIERQVKADQGKPGSQTAEERSIFLIIKDPEPMWEVTFCTWGLIVLSYKLFQVSRRPVNP